MAVFGDRFVASPKFEILKAFESELPLPEFLANLSDHSVSAIIAPVAAPVTADLIHFLPDLRLVVTTSAGVDHVDLIECRRRGISVANAGSSFSEDVLQSVYSSMFSGAFGSLNDGVGHSKGTIPSVPS